ncbi:MAG: VOC family protein [Clostridiales bacterium]|nr:VOC family protein [Clostridiales bacterium]
MKFNSLIPELTVTDIERTKDFYLNILGFKIEYERPENKFIFVSLEGNQMMLEQENGHWSVGELEYPFGRGINFEMTVSDVDAIYKRVLDAGIKPFREMQVSNYRSNDEVVVQKEFLVQDPDGYLLRFTD